MCTLPADLVRAEHAYTSSKVPWRMDADVIQEGENVTDETAATRRLFHYLSGGGLRNFGRTVLQEERDIRQRRFLKIAAAAGVSWLILFIF